MTSFLDPQEMLWESAHSQEKNAFFQTHAGMVTDNFCTCVILALGALLSWARQVDELGLKRGCVHSRFPT